MLFDNIRKYRFCLAADARFTIGLYMNAHPMVCIYLAIQCVPPFILGLGWVGGGCEAGVFGVWGGGGGG